MLTFLHQKGALSHERSFGSSLDPLIFGIPQDKSPENSSNNLLDAKDLDLKAISNTTAEELMVFDSDSCHFYVNSCVTGGLTGFKSDFIDGLHAAET